MKLLTIVFTAFIIALSANAASYLSESSAEKVAVVACNEEFESPSRMPGFLYTHQIRFTKETLLWNVTLAENLPNGLVVVCNVTIDDKTKSVKKVELYEVP